MKRATYNEFPAFISMHVARELLDGETTAKELYPLYTHLEKIEINSIDLFRHLIIISRHFEYNLMAFELRVDSAKGFRRCKEIVDSSLFDSEDMHYRLKRELMHKMLDAYIDTE